MRQIFGVAIAVLILMLSACQTVTSIANLGDNTTYLEATELDASGNREEAFNKFLSISNNDSYSGAQSAQYRVAQGYLKGDGVQRNLPLAIKWFQRVAKGPDFSWSQHAYYALGSIYDVYNEYGAGVDLVKAHEYYSNCAETGDENCLSEKKRLERYPDIYVSTNKSSFYDSSDKVAPYGMEMGYKYFKEGNHSEAFRVFLFHAMKGNVSAQANVAVYYKNGNGTPKDAQKYIAWLYLAAKNGSDISQFELGQNFRLGELVPGSDVEALKWFTHASRQGHAEAYNSIGITYAIPIDSGVRPDYEKSFEYFSKASELGSPNADVNLGDSYITGLGIEKNKPKAKGYYLKAAREGSMAAKKKLLEHFEHYYVLKTPVEVQSTSPGKSNILKPEVQIAEKDVDGRDEYKKEKDKRETRKTPVQLFSDLNLSVYKILALNENEYIDNENNATVCRQTNVVSELI